MCMSVSAAVTEKQHNFPTPWTDATFPTTGQIQLPNSRGQPPWEGVMPAAVGPVGSEDAKHILSCVCSKYDSVR